MTKRRLDDDLRPRQERRGLRMPVAAKAEHCRDVAEHLRHVRERRDPDPAADEQRARDVEVEAVPERAEHAQRRRPGSSAQSARVPGPIGSIRKHSSPAS